MYKKMYCKLLNAVTDALNDMSKLNYAQAESEEIFLDGGEDGE